MQETEYVYGLKDYLRIFRERWRTISAVTILVLMASLVFTYVRDGSEASVPSTEEASAPPIEESPETTPPLYVIVEAPPSFGGFVTAATQQVDPEVERLRILSSDVLKDAAQDLGVSEEEIGSVISVEPLGGGGVFAVRSAALDGVSSGDVAVAVAETYLSDRQDGVSRRYRVAIQQLAARVAALRQAQAGNAERIAALEAQIAQLRAEEAATDAGDIIDAPAYAAQANATPAPTPVVEPVTPVEPAGRPYARNGIAGLVLGLILGAGVALLQDVLDPRFRDVEQVERGLAIPVMAILGADDAARQHGAESLQAQILHNGLSSVALVSLTDKGTERELAQGMSSAPQAAAVNAPDIVTVSAITDPGGYLAKAGAAGAAVLVIDRDVVAREDAVRALGNLRRSGAEVLGAVVA